MAIPSPAARRKPSPMAAAKASPTALHREKISISGTKVWDDLNDKDGIRPESVTIRLYANSVDTGKTAVVNKKGPVHLGIHQP